MVSSIGFFRNHLVVVFCLLLGFVIFVKTCIVQGSCGSGICLLITGFLGSHLWVDVRFKLLGLHCLWFLFLFQILFGTMPEAWNGGFYRVLSEGFLEDAEFFFKLLGIFLKAWFLFAMFELSADLKMWC